MLVNWYDALVEHQAVISHHPLASTLRLVLPICIGLCRLVTIVQLEVSQKQKAISSGLLLIAEAFLIHALLPTNMDYPRISMFFYIQTFASAMLNAVLIGSVLRGEKFKD